MSPDQMSSLSASRMSGENGMNPAAQLNTAIERWCREQRTRQWRFGSVAINASPWTNLAVPGATSRTNFVCDAPAAAPAIALQAGPTSSWAIARIPTPMFLRSTIFTRSIRNVSRFPHVWRRYF